MIGTTRKARALAATVLGSAFLAAGLAPSMAADVTQFRLENAQNEPNNWLTALGNYEGWMYSRLSQINRDNVGDLRVAFTVPLNSALIGNANPSMSNHMLVDDGYAYVDDGWGAIYKIDLRSGTSGTFLWKADGAVSKDERNRTRGMAMWGNAVYHNLTDGRVIAVDRDSGEFLWDLQVARVDAPGHSGVNIEEEGFTAAPLAVDGMILVGQSNGDDLTRGWLAALDPETGAELWRTYTVPGPGEPGHETWKDENNVWMVGGAALWTVGTYDPASRLTYWGTGNAQPMFDVEYRPGDNLYSDAVMAFDVDDGSIEWYFQYVANEGWDYDENGIHQIYTVPVNGVDTRVLGHWGRNGYHYRFNAADGTFLDAEQYVDEVNWTAGIDPKTGKPVEYDPTLDVQVYIPETRFLRGDPPEMACPTATGGVRWQPVAYNPVKMISYSAGRDGCFARPVIASVPLGPNGTLGIDPNQGGGIRGAGPTTNYNIHGLVAAVDVVSNSIIAKQRVPHDITSGIMATAGGLAFTALQDGGVIALDDETLQILWRFDTGIPLKSAPQTFAVPSGRQLVSVIAGGSASGATFPELALMQRGAMLYFFSL
ncbi:MAG: PQQ-binding-like beta-propeller repeat protein [Bauldia sp.]|nr:PQQ-binding-like beta-propeller repeat protein [Bauldia sp.]